MDELTKQVFRAPWKLKNVATCSYDILDENNEIVLGVYGQKNACRFFHIPDLHDALLNAIFEINRLTEAWENGVKFPDYCDSCLAENRKLPHENTMEWAILLGKVKDGEP